MLAAVVLAQAPAQPAPAPSSPAPVAEVSKTIVPAPTRVLKLMEAIEIARKSNLDIQQLNARVDAARQLSWKAWSSYLPWVSARGQGVRNQYEVNFDLPAGYWVRDTGQQQGPPAGGTVPGAPTNYVLYPSDMVSSTIQPYTQLQGQLQVNQALIAPPAWFLIANAYSAERVVDYNVQQARRDILFAVAQLYYGVAALKQLIEVQERQVTLTRERERDARVRYQAGTAAKVGLLRAEIDRAQAEEDLKRAQIDFQRAKLALATALDRPDDFDVVVPPPPQPPTGDDLGKQALALRPDVKAAAESVSLAHGQRTELYMRYLPSLGAFGSYNYTRATTFTPYEYSWQVGLGLTWNILDGGLREAQIREQTARIVEAEAAQKLTDLKAVNRVKEAQLDLEAAVANRAKAKERTDLAQENARLVDVAYKAGAATYLESTDSVQALRQAEVGLVAESLNVDLATLKLLNAVGAFEEINN